MTSSAAPPQPGVAPPGLPMVDLSRPPPGFGLGPAEPERPSAPYYDLPAGLMVPLVSDVPYSSQLVIFAQNCVNSCEVLVCPIHNLNCI